MTPTFFEVPVTDNKMSQFLRSLQTTRGDYVAKRNVAAAIFLRHLEEDYPQGILPYRTLLSGPNVCKYKS